MTTNGQETNSNFRAGAITAGIIAGLGAIGGVIAVLVAQSTGPLIQDLLWLIIV